MVAELDGGVGGMTKTAFDSLCENCGNPIAQHRDTYRDPCHPDVYRILCPTPFAPAMGRIPDHRVSKS